MNDNNYSKTDLENIVLLFFPSLPTLAILGVKIFVALNG